MKKTRVATKLMFAAIIISLLCVSLGLLSVGQLELKGEQIIKVVFDSSGKIWTAFPVK